MKSSINWKDIPFTDPIWKGAVIKGHNNGVAIGAIIYNSSPQLLVKLDQGKGHNGRGHTLVWGEFSSQPDNWYFIPNDIASVEFTEQQELQYEIFN